MHTIKIQVGENIYEHIMYLLKSIKSDDLKILEESKQADTKQQIKTLFENKKTDMFSSISDPLKWQEEQRKEWR